MWSSSKWNTCVKGKKEKGTHWWERWFWCASSARSSSPAAPGGTRRRCPPTAPTAPGSERRHCSEALREETSALALDFPPRWHRRRRRQSYQPLWWWWPAPSHSPAAPGVGRRRWSWSSRWRRAPGAGRRRWRCTRGRWRHWGRH